jgi:hypothetical protein
MNKEIPLKKVKEVLSVLAGIAIAGCIAVFISAFRSALIGFSRFSAGTAASALNSFGYTRRSGSCFFIVFSSSVVVHAYLSVHQKG